MTADESEGHQIERRLRELGSGLWEIVVSNYAFFLLAVVAVALLELLLISKVGTEIARIMIDSILTLALIVLYAGIAKAEERQADLQEEVLDIQDKQADILNQQRELTKAISRPVLVIDSWKAEGDVLEFKIKNVGNETALDVGVFVGIRFFERMPSITEWEDDIELEPHWSLPLNRLDEDTRKRNAVEPDEQVIFRINAWVSTLNQDSGGTHERNRFEDLIFDQIRGDSHMEALTLVIFLSFRGIIDDDYRFKPVWGMGTEVQELSTIEDLFGVQSFTIPHWENLVYPDNLEGMEQAWEKLR